MVPSSTALIKQTLLRVLNPLTGPRDKKATVLALFLEAYAETLEPKEALRVLLELNHRVYKLLGRQAIRYGGGVHTKHAHMKYHDFFVDNIRPGAHVLDVGCGIGALAYSIADRVPNVRVLGIDIVEANLRTARERFARDNVEYLLCDATGALPERPIDTVVLSNVLEHIDARVQLLRNLITRYAPHTVLIRVPMYERDWLVPLKQELGVEYRLDSTHCTEYRLGELENELAAAGLVIEDKTVRWGEIWVRTRPRSAALRT
jgi:2-polyprenyl-3-methyl-5-hydroxy-6-metoxy-1,4-benzoquinol methylase